MVTNSASLFAKRTRATRTCREVSTFNNTRLTVHQTHGPFLSVECLPTVAFVKLQKQQLIVRNFCQNSPELALTR